MKKRSLSADSAAECVETFTDVNDLGAEEIYQSGARGRSRTDTLLRAADFESAASTNSATRASRGSGGGEYKGPLAARVWGGVTGGTRKAKPRACSPARAV